MHLRITLWLDNVMAFLDSEDLSAIKKILEDVLEEKLDKLGFEIGNFITREEFYEKTEEILDTARPFQRRRFINST